MGNKVRVGDLADAVMKELDDYAKLSTEGMKKAVRDAAKTVRSDIQSGAPKDTGAYARSWSVKTTRENSNSLELTVHSRNRYQLAHLLEFGHAKRNGGRVSGRAHIAPAEQAGIEQLERDVTRSLKNG